MTNMYALQSFSIALSATHIDHVHKGALRDSASATVTGTPASFWKSSPLTLLEAGGCASLVGYMLANPAGP